MKVKFVPQNLEFEIKPGESVLHLAQDNGIYIKSVCKGVPSCAECRVRVTEGDHNVLPPGSEELSLIGTGHFIDRRRLSCQLKCFGDITVDMNEQIAKEQGIIVGRKKKLSAKDDRVEAVVRRGDTESPVAEDSGEPSIDVALAETPPGEARPSRPGARTERPARDERRPREDRGGRDNRPTARDQQARGPGAGPSRPGSGPSQAPSAAADGAPNIEGAAGTGESREGGVRKRRRRRGKGGGGSGNGSGGNGGPSGPGGGTV